MLWWFRDRLSASLGVPGEQIGATTRISEDLDADSLDVVELVMSLEDEFEVTIPDDAYEQLQTVGDVVRYLQNLRHDG